VDYFLLIIKTLFIGTTPLLMPAKLKKISLNTITLNMFETLHLIERHGQNKSRGQRCDEKHGKGNTRKNC
jgi:hypothetical protein